MTLRILLMTSVASAFLQGDTGRHCSSRMFGISEWRELEVMGLPRPSTSPIVRTVPIMPFSSNKVLLQGQTTHLQFLEDDEVRLFQRALDKHEGVFGMGLLQTDGEEEILLEKMPLLEIQDYNMMGGDFGIFCSAKVVGRATIHSVANEDGDVEPITVVCSESYDTFENSSLELANSVASMVENLIADISDVEQSSVLANPDFGKLRLDMTIHDPSRMDRFKEAYEAALDSDRQGYLVSSPSSTTSNRSWRELNAISWSAFSTGACLARDASFRVNALDMENVTNRLKLAMYWLSDVRFDLQQATEQ